MLVKLALHELCRTVRGIVNEAFCPVLSRPGKPTRARDQRRMQPQKLAHHKAPLKPAFQTQLWPQANIENRGLEYHLVRQRIFCMAYQELTLANGL